MTKTYALEVLEVGGRRYEPGEEVGNLSTEDRKALTDGGAIGTRQEWLRTVGRRDQELAAATDDDGNRHIRAGDSGQGGDRKR